MLIAGLNPPVICVNAVLQTTVSARLKTCRHFTPPGTAGRNFLRAIIFACSLRSLCSLCLCGEKDAEDIHHGDTEVTETCTENENVFVKSAAIQSGLK